MKVSVIGQGYVGLTIAMGAAAVGHRVIGLDVNEKLISQLFQGNSYVPGVNKELLVRLIQSSQYLPTSDSNLIHDSENLSDWAKITLGFNYMKSPEELHQIIPYLEKVLPDYILQ